MRRRLGRRQVACLLVLERCGCLRWMTDVTGELRRVLDSLVARGLVQRTEETSTVAGRERSRTAYSVTRLGRLVLSHESQGHV